MLDLRDPWSLEGWPDPVIIVLDGMGQVFFDFMTDVIARSMVSGRFAEPSGVPPCGAWSRLRRRRGRRPHEMQEMLLMFDLVCSCSSASSSKHGLGWLGSGTGRFDGGLNSEICAFWKSCQI